MPAATVSGRKPRSWRSCNWARDEFKANQSFSFFAIASLYAAFTVSGVPTSTSSAEVVAYVGLNPRQHQSGTSIDRVTRISKIGNAVLRAAHAGDVGDAI
jgi:hypothetical protein